MTTHEIAIVGGGVAGLSTAYELRAHDVVVLEGAARVGGNVRTLRRDGCTIDLGPDALLVRPESAVALCRELGLEGQLEEPSGGRVLVAHRGRLHELPEGLVFGVPRSIATVARTPLLTLRGKLRAALDLVLPASAAELGLGVLVEKRMGREVKEALVEPLVGGVHGGHIDRLDPAVVMPALASSRGSLIRALASAPKPKGSPVRAPRRGMDALIDGLRAAIGPERLRTDCPVRALRRDGARFVLVTDREEIVAGRVILAVPPAVASKLLRDVDRELAGAIATIRVRASASVVLAFDRDAAMFPDATGLLVSRGEAGSFVAATWVHEKWPDRVAPGMAVLRAVVSADRTPELVEGADDEIVARVLEDLRRYVQPLGEPRWTLVERFEAASPVPELGHRERVSAIRAELARHAGLHLVGAAFDGHGIAGCIRGARALAATLTPSASRGDGARERDAEHPSLLRERRLERAAAGA